MRNIVHVVGNRPQFIKLAPLYHELEKRGYKQDIVHSGQHYDENLSDIFFRELNIPNPLVNLQIGSGTHAEMTAKAMLGLEKKLVELEPALVVLYGDTDTTLAGALTASKLNIPIAHVEGGTRTLNKNNPEECNRIVVDHLSSILFCPDKISVEHAVREGLGQFAFDTGDIMYDTFLSTSGNCQEEANIVVMTWHRQENTVSKERMENILSLIVELKELVICPLHPRTVKCLKEFGLWESALRIDNFKMIEPVGYFEMVSLLQSAKLILTDSGGLSKESSFAGAKCLFFADLDIWPDLQKYGWLLKIDPDSSDSRNAALDFAKKAKKVQKSQRPQFYGDGKAAKKIVDLLEKHLLVEVV